jgi:DNA repair protein RadD
MTLRSYQSKALADIYGAWADGYRRILLVMPTAAGKTRVIQTIASGNHSKHKRAWFLEHRAELIQQSSDSFNAAGINHSVIRAGSIDNAQAGIQIASVQTIVNRLDKLPRPDLVLPDEAHHCSASQWRAVINHHDVPRIGCTATPCRLDGQGLGEFFDVIVEGPTIRQLIDMTREDGRPGGYLAPYRLFVAPLAEDISDIRKRGGDLPGEAVYRRIRGAKRTGDIVQHYGDLCNGTRAILRACTIADSVEIAASFCAAGIKAEHMDGAMREDDRRAAFARFQAGETHVLTQCDLFGEGLHVPGVGCVIHAAPTASLSRYMQLNGRGFQAKPDGSALWILDHAGCSGSVSNGVMIPNHGLPDDDRIWTLEGKARRAGDEAPIAIRECPKCGGVVRAHVTRCPDPCGYEWHTASKPIREQDGVLVEIDARSKREIAADAKAKAAADRAAAKEAKAEQKRLQAILDDQRRADRKAKEMSCATFEDLVALFRARGSPTPEGAARHKWRYIEMGRAARARAQEKRRYG